MNSLSNLTERIQAAFATMSPQFQQSARYVLDHADQVPLMSMRQLAAQAQVQPATLLRFAQSLGFGGWAEFKAVFTQALHGQGGGGMPIRLGQWCAIEIKKIAWRRR